METGHTVGWTKQHIQTLLNAMKSSIPSQDAEKIWSEGLKTLDWNKVAFEPFSAEECSAKWQEIMQKIRKVKTLPELIVDAQNVFSNKVTRKKFPLVPQKPVSAKSPEIKDKYLQRAQKTKEEYRNSMEILSPRPKGKQSKKGSHTKERSAKSLLKQLQSLLIKKSSREENETKTKLLVPPPKTGYNLFCREQKGLMTGVPILEIPTTWSQRWTNLTDMEKSKYTRRCAEMNEEYNVKLITFLNDLDDEQAQHLKTLVPTLKRKQVTTGRVFAGEPKMPTRATKSFFRKRQKEMRGTVENATECLSQANCGFNSLSSKEKEQEKEHIYSLELQRWFETLSATEQQEYCEHNPAKLNYLQCKSEQGTSHHRTSDSEDEVLEVSSSDSDVIVEQEEDEEDEDIMFDIY